MGRYVDGFVLAVPTRKVGAYRRMARQAGKVWRDHGALEFRECVADDLKVKGAIPFARLLRLKPGETAFFSYIGYRSRAHRDRVNARVMKDPRITGSSLTGMPFDPRRMAYGGFRVLVDL
jgi:uncharacterized protein YbaA (DUF1428 family)